MAKYIRDEIMPIRQKILNESLLRYNGNLIGTASGAGPEYTATVNVDASLSPSLQAGFNNVSTVATSLVRSPGAACDGRAGSARPRAGLSARNPAVPDRAVRQRN